MDRKYLGFLLVLVVAGIVPLGGILLLLLKSASGTQVEVAGMVGMILIMVAAAAVPCALYVVRPSLRCLPGLDDRRMQRLAWLSWLVAVSILMGGGAVWFQAITGSGQPLLYVFDVIVALSLVPLMRLAMPLWHKYYRDMWAQTNPTEWQRWGHLSDAKLYHEDVRWLFEVSRGHPGRDA